MKHVHFIGIGGSGLSAMAMVLLERGYTVSGSDRQLSPLAQALQQAGARVFLGHRAENVSGADLVVRSSAIPDENVEVQAARAAGVSVLKRADFLEQLMASQQVIGVAGTHGKTTTTAMIAWMLSSLGLDPSYIVGGVSQNLGRNAHAGQGQWFVIEADEYDRMFLGLRPSLAVVTNIEHDHPDCYPTAADFYQAFQEYASHLVQGGALVACGEDPGAARLLAWAAAQGLRTQTYGLSDADWDYCAKDLSVNAQGGFRFALSCQNCPAPQPVSLVVPGEHNVRNALAALAVADQLHLPLRRAASALGEFRGAGRRFEVRGEQAGVTVIDDYAHHPTEIRATLAAARARFPGRRLWAVWQPHTYSRTRTLFDGFVSALSQADQVIVTEVYAAREAAPVDGFSGDWLVRALSDAGAPAQFAPGLVEAKDELVHNLQSGDVVLVLSAGDADQISTQVLQSLEAQAGPHRRGEKNA
ncbi:MAG: UDP-N-acetylmuramate--L-alanine ligase [Chloroflexota bacterium]